MKHQAIRATASDRGQREDAFIWALKVAKTGVPVSAVLAGADAIRAFMGGQLAPVEVAITTIQSLRDSLSSKGDRDMPMSVGALDEFLNDLVRDLREPLIDAEIVDDEKPRPEWADVAAFNDLIAEHDRARDTAVRLEQENAELERKLEEVALISARMQQSLLEAAQELETARTGLIHGLLLDLQRFANNSNTDARRVFVLDALRHLSTRYGVEL